MSRPPVTKWFPDLHRVESGSARNALWLAAYRPVLRSPACWLIALAAQIAAQIAVVVPLSRLARRWSLYGPGIQYVLPGVVAASTVFLISGCRTSNGILTRSSYIGHGSPLARVCFPM